VLDNGRIPVAFHPTWKAIGRLDRPQPRSTGRHAKAVYSIV